MVGTRAGLRVRFKAPVSNFKRRRLSPAPPLYAVRLIRPINTLRRSDRPVFLLVS